MWTKGDAFAEIIDQTVQHVKTTYQHSNTKVFDHDSGPSTEDHTGGVQGVAINFMLKTMFCTNMKTFLSNHFNKQKSINRLGSKLVENEIFFKHLSGDADYLIALTKIEKVKKNNVVCIQMIYFGTFIPVCSELHSIFIWRCQVAMSQHPQWNIFEL